MGSAMDNREADPPPMSLTDETRRLIRSIVGFPELAMRVAWLGEQFDGKSDESIARVLDLLTAYSQLPDESARESTLALSVLLARRRDSAWLWALHQTAKQHALINLERTLRPTTSGPPSSRDQPELPVPDYGGGRPLSVGERKSIARRPTRLQLERLLHDPHPLVIAQLLSAPGLTE